MTPDARATLKTIRRCIADGRYRVLRHFTRRMDERGLFWADVAGVLDKPDNLTEAGPDDFGRAKWIITGQTYDGLPLELIAALDIDDDGALTVFITLYWQGKTP